MCAEDASRFKEKTEGRGGGYACGKYAARQDSERRFTAAGGSAGAPPRAPFRELFEKSSLKTFKNFWEKGKKLFCAQRMQVGLRRKRKDEAEGMRAGNTRRGRTRKGDLRLPEGSAGAPPRAPFRELFEKSSLKTLKNFWEKRKKLFCAQRVQVGLRRKRKDEAEGMRAGNKRRGRTRKGGLRLPGECRGAAPDPVQGTF